MSLLLAGLTVLVIGDSHVTTKDYLASTLHDSLMQQGAKVYSYGACGSLSSDWMKNTRPACGSAFRLDSGPLRVRTGEVAFTKPLPELVKEHHPDLIIVVNGDTIAGYKDKVIPKAWIYGQVTTLTKGIQDSGARCVWVGPGWGADGVFQKKDARVKEMSDYLAGIVHPCVYIDSLKMSSPGEWETIAGDGQHYLPSGYKAWGSAITTAITAPSVLSTLNLQPK